MGMILRIASSRIVGQGDIVGRSGYFSLNLSANSVMRGRLDARRTLKSLVADLRVIKIMERSGNFYKAIRLGYILISILIGCMAYNSLYEWQEIEALELGNKKIDELRKEINNINIQMIKFSLLGET